MRATRILDLLAIGTGVALGCKNTTAIPSSVEIYTATLNGSNERPTAVTTTATGAATFTVLGNLVSWKVDITSAIDSVTIGHIHRGVADSAGGVIDRRGLHRHGGPRLAQRGGFGTDAHARWQVVRQHPHEKEPRWRDPGATGQAVIAGMNGTGGEPGRLPPSPWYRFHPAQLLPLCDAARRRARTVCARSSRT